MLQKSKNLIAETLWKPKKTHSLEQLRYLHYILQRNSTVTEGNKGLVVETLRSIAEILIWGDQNDSTVFDFFLEKNMLLFFLKFMTQNCGSYVTVQLLQTLNILFENIRHETSLYFLLSNNHVNSIIVHKFDFSNEEVLAYYISFLKTLSLKLNLQTINFFFNERKSDFPLYTEGIKFFHHSESMVRIAVRTLSLNVYKVGHEKMIEFICDKTATPYFSNLIWFIGKDAIELDDCVLQESDHFKYDKLKASVADHLDHLHYLNDIFQLNINVLNMILTDHMINRLLIPLYVYSLPLKEDLEGGKNPERVTISRLVALFLLAQHLLIMEHSPLVNAIVDVIFNEDEIHSTAYTPETPDVEDRKSLLSNTSSSLRAFIPPPAPLESQLEACGVTKDTYNLSLKLQLLTSEKSKRYSTFYVTEDGTLKLRDDTSGSASGEKGEGENRSDVDSVHSLNFEDDDDTENVGKSALLSLAKKADAEAEALLSEAKEKEAEKALVDRDSESAPAYDVDDINSSLQSAEDSDDAKQQATGSCKRLFMRSVIKSLDLSNGDGQAFFALCLLYTILTNKGLNRELLISIGLSLPEESDEYNEEIVEQLLTLLESGINDEARMRLVTVEMCIKVIRLLIIQGDVKRISDHHFAMLESIREASTLQLRHFYKGDDLFVDTFEGEYHHMKAKPINVEYLTMDASLLLPPTVTPLTGIDFIKRLPCGDAERTQRAAHIFVLMRELSLDLDGDTEHYLPLSKVQNPVKENEVLDLNNSDLIACTILQQSKQSIRRFLVIDTSQFILVEPDTSKLGWGVVKFVSHLQDVEANPDKDDSRSLNIVIQQPFTRRSRSGFNPLPVMTAKFVFDDYIRCMSARQRLQKRRDALRHRKMSTIAMLLDLPPLASPPQSYYSLTNVESPGSVWSPSSRGYSSLRGDPTSLNTSSGSFTILTPPPSSSKSKLLSPKMEQILQKQLKGEKITQKSPRMKLASSTRRSTNPSLTVSTRQTPVKVVDSTATPGPVEIAGHDTGRVRTGTTEVGEELVEDTVTLAANNSSYILINDSLCIDRSKVAVTANGLDLIDSYKPSSGETAPACSVVQNSTSALQQCIIEDDPETNRHIFATIRDQLHEHDSKWDTLQARLKTESSNGKSNKSERLNVRGSAPGTPRGRKLYCDNASSRNRRLTQSLPPIPLPSAEDDRHKRAARARAKAKKSRGGGGRKKKR